MATSSIFHDIVIDNKAKAKKLLRALEKAEDFAKGITKYPFPDRGLVDSKEWNRLLEVCGLEFYGYPEKNSDYYGYDNDIFQINPFYWGDCECKTDENGVNHIRGCPVIRHNFIYKPTGFWIDWYKYPFRAADMSDNLTKKEIKTIWKKCIKSAKLHR